MHRHSPREFCRVQKQNSCQTQRVSWLPSICWLPSLVADRTHPGQPGGRAQRKGPQDPGRRGACTKKTGASWPHFNKRNDMALISTITITSKQASMHACMTITVMKSYCHACMHACLLACDCDCWNQCHVISFVEVWPRLKRLEPLGHTSTKEMTWHWFQQSQSQASKQASMHACMTIWLHNCDLLQE